MEFTRLKQLLKENQFQKLQESCVCIVGLGGVGSYAVEAIARSGVKKIILVDNDIVDRTNINRQLIALQSTIGMNKVDVCEKRIKEINPNCLIVKHNMFLNSDNYDIIFQEKIDFLIDAIDTITSKILLIKYCLKIDIPFISSMGTANKFHPDQLEISDLSKTSYCPIAKIIRNRLKKDGIKGKIPVVYSKELPKKNNGLLGSTAFVPGTCGLLLASYVINNLIKD